MTAPKTCITCARCIEFAGLLYCGRTVDHVAGEHILCQEARAGAGVTWMGAPGVEACDLGGSEWISRSTPVDKPQGESKAPRRSAE